MIDPGWEPAFREAWKYLLFPHATLGVRSKSSTLAVLRAFALAMPMQWLIFLGALAPLHRPARMGPLWPIALPLFGGVESIIVINIFLERRWTTDALRSLTRVDALNLAGMMRAQFFLGFAMAEAAVLFGFVAYFVVGRLWVYLIGLPFGLAGLARIAPTRPFLERRQRQLSLAGIAVDIVGALSIPSRDLPRPARSKG